MFINDTVSLKQAKELFQPKVGIFVALFIKLKVSTNLQPIPNKSMFLANFLKSKWKSRAITQFMKFFLTFWEICKRIRCLIINVFLVFSTKSKKVFLLEVWLLDLTSKFFTCLFNCSIFLVEEHASGRLVLSGASSSSKKDALNN